MARHFPVLHFPDPVILLRVCKMLSVIFQSCIFQTLQFLAKFSVIFQSCILGRAFSVALFKPGLQQTAHTMARTSTTMNILIFRNSFDDEKAKMFSSLGGFTPDLANNQCIVCAAAISDKHGTLQK